MTEEELTITAAKYADGLSSGDIYWKDVYDAFIAGAKYIQKLQMEKI